MFGSNDIISNDNTDSELQIAIFNRALKPTHLCGLAASRCGCLHSADRKTRFRVAFVKVRHKQKNTASVRRFYSSCAFVTEHTDENNGSQIIDRYLPQ